jgi:hypothetical protein
MEYWPGTFRNNALMQYKSYNYNNFIICFTGNICPNTIDSLIKYLINIKNKYIFINKLNIFIWIKTILTNGFTIKDILASRIKFYIY